MADWPLPAHEQQLVGELAHLIARGGAWRFLNAPVVAANAKDYPDTWDATRTAVARVAARTMWHAFLDVDAVVDDDRQPAWGTRRELLRDTKIELFAVDDARVELLMTALGNDDVAGAIAHEVGRACVALLARGGEPFRATVATDEAAKLPDTRTGSLATVYCGLGVIAANSAHYDRSVGELVGRSAVHEHHVVQAGGLAARDLAFLLAVQATVRDDVLPALETLRPTQATALAEWIDVLDDHEAELRDSLGLGDATALAAESPPTRRAAPRAPVATGAVDEENLRKPNVGYSMHRYWEKTPITNAFLGAVGGGLLGLLALGVAPVLVAALPVFGAVGGLLHGLRPAYRCGMCRAYTPLAAPTCKRCGATLTHVLGSEKQHVALLAAAVERDDATAETPESRDPIAGDAASH